MNRAQANLLTTKDKYEKILAVTSMGNSGSPEKRFSSETDGPPLKQNLTPRKSKEIDRNIACVTPINIKDSTLAEEKKIVKISIIGSNSVGKKTLFCQYLFVSNIFILCQLNVATY